MAMTRVISVRGHKRAELEVDPNFRYVGRSVRFTTWTEASFWMNRFSVKQYGSQALPLFVEDLLQRLERYGLRERLIEELQGKTLGCWCGTWEPGQPDIGCHAVVLAKLAEGMETLAEQRASG